MKMFSAFPMRSSLTLCLILASFSVSLSHASLVFFNPTLGYVYRYEGTTVLKNAGTIDSEAQITILWLEDVTDGQHCQMTIDSIRYKLSHNDQGLLGSHGSQESDFSKWFSFVISRHGEISSVFYQDDGAAEIILLKKILLGTLSARLHATEGAIKHGAPWSYKVNETGHEGGHESTYSVKKSTGGLHFQKTKHGHVVPNANASHTKEILYDHSLQVPHAISVEEHFTAPKKAPPGFDAHAGLPGDNAKHRQQKTKDSPDLPDMHGTSSSTMKLVERLHRTDHVVIPRNLIQDTLKIDTVPRPNVYLSEVYEDIVTNMTCMREHQSAKSPEKAKCFHCLLNIASRLPAENVTHLAEKYIGRNLTELPVAEHIRNREIMIDVLGAVATETPQILITDMVLLSNRPNASLIMRALLHFVELKRPPPEVFVAGLETLVFNRIHQFPDPDDTRMVYNRAMLVLGSVANCLLRSSQTRDVERGNAIVERVEDALGVHDPWHHRQIRSSLSEKEYNKHLELKGTLITTLGNALSISSFEHILSYINNSDSHPILRRSGIYAIGRYDMSEVPSVLLSSALNDVDETVRYVAVTEYGRHPRTPFIDNVGTLFSDRNASNSVSKPRGRRSIFQGFEFHLSTPKIDWRYEIGSADIGAEMGLIMKNNLDIDIQPLEGFLEIDIHDHVYARGLIGYIGETFDFIDAKVCFRGRGEYDVNILQEFSFDDVSNLVSLFDDVVQRVVDSVQNVIKSFDKILAPDPNKKDLGEIFESFASAVKEMPSKMKNVRRIAKSVLKRVGNYTNLPEFSLEIQAVVERVSAIFASIKEDVMELYHAIADAVTVTLPWAVEQLEDAISTAAEATQKLFESPMTAVNDIARFDLQIRGAIMGVLDAKKRIEDACFFTEGNEPYWFDMRSLLSSIMDDIYNAKGTLNEAVSWVNEGIESDNKMKYILGFDERDLRQSILDDINEALDVFTEPLEDLKSLADPFTETYKAVTDVIEEVKGGYADMKSAYEYAKSFLNKIFGSHSSPEFPKKIAESDCGDGFYPSETGGLSPGIDLEIDAGKTLVSPFTGTVRKSGSKQSIIRIADEIKDIDVIIDHVETSEETDGRLTFKGLPLGIVAESGCSPNTIHLSMRKVDSGQYVDPTPYIHKRELTASYRQTCDEYYLNFKKISVSGPLSLTKGPKRKDERPKRTRQPNTEELDKIVQKKPKRSPSNNPLKGGLGKLGLPTITSNGPPTVNFSLQTIGLNSVFEFLREAKDSAVETALQTLIDQLKEKFSSLAKDFRRPETMDDDELRMALLARSVTVGSASRTTLIKMYRELDYRFSSFKNFVPKNSFCNFDENGLGVECNVEMPVSYFPLSINGFARLDVCELKFLMGLHDWRKEIDLGELLYDGPLEDSGSFSLDVPILKAVELSYEYKIERHGVTVLFDMKVSVCATAIDYCLPYMNIFNNLTYEIIPCGASAAVLETRPDPGLLLEDLTLVKLEALLDIVDIDPAEVAKIMEDILIAVKDAVIDEMMTKLKDFFDDEFKRFDIKLSGAVNFGPYDVAFIDEKWYPFMLGPVPMMFGYGAGGSYSMSFSTEVTILSMKAEMKSTPELGCYVWGSLAIGIPMFFAELRLTGYLMTTSFPSKAAVKFNTFPLDVDARMDLVVVPLKLELRGRCVFKLKALFVDIEEVIVDVKIWGYTTPTIEKNIFDMGDLEPDETAPTFRKYGLQELELEALHGSKRSSPPSTDCEVSQVAGRDYVEPAFQLSVAVDDDKSEVELTFCVGTYKSGCDILKDQSMRGSSIVVAEVLPGGIPVHFTVKAINSAREESLATCSLPTYDVTLPGGRILPEFISTSRPDILRASAVAYDDSELISKRGAVGFGIGIQGDQLVPWSDIHYSTTVETKSSSMGSFTSGRRGRLNAAPGAVEAFSSVDACAKHCLKLPTSQCVSFNYDYGGSGQCEPLQQIEGNGIELHESGKFHYFERLGIGHTVQFDHDNLQLRHGDTHYFNLLVTNVLGYENVMTSQPVVADFTPPSPGIIKSAPYDQTYHESCEDLLPDKWHGRCTEQTSLNNHRFIVDGPGSKTVFNGHEPLQDLLYTRANTYVSANWDGFHDDETGIYGYTWTVGTDQCLDDIQPHRDPHAFLFDESEWTHTGLAHPLPVRYLSDGRYYVTVRAINKVEFGGPMVTTVCHTTPYTIDNTPPFVHEVFNVQYDESDCTIRTEYNVSDDLSHIREIDFGLGQSPRDVYIMDWEKESNISHIALPFCIPDGVPAWIKVRAINNVDIRAVGYAPSPLVVDTSTPVAGEVFDGTVHDHDIDYQSFDDEICVSWHNFYDQESSIEKYIWFVGTSPGGNDTIPSMELSHSEYRACSNDVTLVHDVTYYSTLIAVNAGHKNLQTNVTTDGVLYDATPPEEGWIKDGLDSTDDVVYASESATVAANWGGFYDPESSIKEYKVAVWRKHADKGGMSYPLQIIHQAETVSADSNYINWHHFHLHHGDYVQVALEAVNNALSGTALSSNGYTVDLTEPVVYFVGDGSTAGIDTRFTASIHQLSANWDFEDDESGVDHYKLSIYETFGGTRKRVFPVGNPFEIISGSSTMWVSPNLAKLKEGGHYSIRVSAINGAGLTNVQDTSGVIVDPSPPQMRRIVIGILAAGDEEVIDGFVLETDTEGLKAYWVATDFESGIDTYYVAVGTQPRYTDVLPFTDMGSADGGYLGGLVLEIFQVYYVSVKAQNGAGTMSEVMTSSPIKIVPGDKVGLVIDGPEDVANEGDAVHLDVDYQKESGTVTSKFFGFESIRHGIVHYEWAVGSSPLLDDVQPYISSGIIISNEQGIEGGGLHGSGQAQSLLPLESGATYYTTVRAITGEGNALEAVSDGFTLDTTSPSIHINSVGVTADNETAHSSNDFNVYQKTTDALSASWTIDEEESSIVYTEFCFGSFPGGSDIMNCTETTNIDSIPSTFVNPDPSRPNILTLRTINEVGLEEELTRSGGVTIDTTPPVAGNITCSSHVRSVDQLTCTWTGFVDRESGIDYYEFAIGTSEADDSIFPYTVVDSSVNEYTAKDFKDGPLKPQTYYVTVSATNYVGDTAKGYSPRIIVDETPPVAGRVTELSGVDEVLFGDEDMADPGTTECPVSQGCRQTDSICQKAVDRILVKWEPFQDPESPIERYQVAVGTTPGGTQIRDFYDVDTTNGLTVLVTDVDLYDVYRAFVSVRGHNAAGFYATGTSNGVFISRVSAGLPSIGRSYVWDGTDEGDLDFQDNAEQLSGKWNFAGDPCPITKYEWSILRFDGTVVQPMTVLPDAMTYGVNDAMDMKDGESYYIVVRATNQLGYSYSLRSDGITIQKEPLLPGHVRDGDVMGYDINFQASVKFLSGNWDAFGVHSSQYTEEALGNLEEQQAIDHYEVAVGTDRRYPKTRDDVHPFVNVGLNTSHTFYDLNLVPRRLTYYITVKGYSTSTAMAEMTSNGIVVGIGGTVVSAGEIITPRYISSLTKISISWGKFQFGMPILFYQLGIASSDNFTNTLTCSDLQNFNQESEARDNHKGLFDIYSLTNVGKDTLVTMTHLKLKDKETYNIAVIATDESAQCSLVTQKFSVDLTPPKEGNVYVGALSDKAMVYTSREDILTVAWDGYYDDDSGLKSFSMSIYDGISCGSGEVDHIVLQGDIQVLANDTRYTFADLALQPDHPYYVHLSCTNHAGLTTTTVSKPILLDLKDPVGGVVKDGPLFSDDVEYQSSTSQIEGVFLHLPNPKGNSCPTRQFTFAADSEDDGWHSVNSEGVWNTAHTSVNFRPEQVHYEDDGSLSITMIRNVQRETMYSGAYYNTDPDVPAGGKYQVDILAASGNISAVTSVAFWDGPNGVVGDFDAPVGERDWMDENREYDNCRLCCVQIGDGNSTNDCLCNCTEYLLRPITTTPGGHTTTITTAMLTSTTGPPPWDIVDDEDPDDSFTGDNRLKNVPFRSTGFQLHPGVPVGDDVKHFAVIWFRHQNSTDAVKYDIAELPFDPSRGWHSYTFNVILNKNELSIELSIDGRALMYMSGLEPMGAAAKFTMSVWNRDGFVPSFDDVFNPPVTVSRFRNVRFPPTTEALCRFGEPFRNGDNAITAFLAGVGSQRFLDDVAPFREVLRPCIPCAKPCDNIECDRSCPTTAVADYHVILDDLNLSPTRMGEENGHVTEVPAVYHLTIKAITGSGRQVVTSSDGVYVDDSEPVFDYLYHVDMDYSEEEPTEYQSGNTTIAVRWSAYDLGSQIKDFRWAIGSQPFGTDVQDMISVGLDTFAIRHDPNGFLQDRHTYYVTVEAINHAGLKTTKTTTGITVLTTPPDTSHSNTTLQCDHPQRIAGKNICSGQNSVGMSWTRIEDNSVDAYYFQIGSREGSDDVFPKFRVGYNTSGSIVIRDGLVFVGDEPLVNISGVRQIAEGQSGMADYGETVYRNRFHMEPGRVLYSVMTVCNKGHKCEKTATAASVLKRNEDFIAAPINGSKIVVSLQESVGVSAVRPDTFVEIEANATNHATSPISDDEDERNVIIVAGLLSGDALEDDYVSDASPTFKPFVVDPKMTKEQTDRHLRNRIKDIIGPSFYVTSVGSDGLAGPLRITLPMNSTLFNDTQIERYPVIAYWHTESQEWRDASRTCRDSFGNYDIKWEEQLLSVEVCSTTQLESNEVSKRSVGTNPFTGPTEFTFASMGSYTNTAPFVTSASDVWMDEDGGTLRFQVTAYDDDGDRLKYKIDDTLPSPQRGTATISVDGGLTYRPCLDCFGVDYIHYVVTEDRDDDVNILSTAATLVIDVRASNDNPRIFLAVDHVNALDDNNYDLLVTLEERRNNETRPDPFEAIAGAFDPDTFDSLALTFERPQHGEFFTGEQHTTVTFIHQDCVTPMANVTQDHLSYESPNTPVVVFPCHFSVPHDESRLSWVLSAIRYLPDEGFFGEDTFKINAIDQSGYHSEVITVHVHTLANPCMNGATCVGPGTDPHCTGTGRSQGFHGYRCKCPPGYVGETCEIDYDECEDDPCGYNYTCTDLLDAFSCHCESPDWPCAGDVQGNFPVVGMAILLSVAVVAFVAIAICAKYRLCPKKKSRKVGPDSSDISNQAGFATVLLDTEASEGDVQDTTTRLTTEEWEEIMLTEPKPVGVVKPPSPTYAWGETKVVTGHAGRGLPTCDAEEESQA